MASGIFVHREVDTHLIIRKIFSKKKQSKLPTFGKITNVNAFEFLDRVEQADPLVYIVVHLYESTIEACNALHTTLESLAREHPHTDFVRLRKSETPTGLPNTSLPSLLIYKAGDLVNTVMSVVDKIGPKCLKEDVEELLVEEGIIGHSHVSL